jgi:hypothetical protein
VCEYERGALAMGLGILEARRWIMGGSRHFVLSSFAGCPD